jgi:hypothetical protein
MIYQGNHPSVSRPQRFTADREFMCLNCGEQGRLLEMDLEGVDDQGEPDVYHCYKVLCSVCDSEHFEFQADAFYSQIIAAQSQAYRSCAENRPHQLRQCQLSGDWGQFQEYYWSEVYSLLRKIADDLEEFDLLLFKSVAATLGWLVNIDQDGGVNEDDFNILAESEADHDETVDVDRALSVIAENLSRLSRPDGLRQIA